MPAAALAASNKPQYLPPIAPSLDTSATRNDNNPSAAPAPAPSPSPFPTASSSPGDNDRSSSSESSDRVKSLMRQALVSHNNGDRNTAAKLFRQVLAIDPHNTDANFNLGAMAEDAGDLNGALYYYQTAQRFSPSDADIADAVKSVQMKMHQQQTAQQETAVLQQKEQLRAIAQDAAGAYKAGQYDRAIGDLQQVLRNDPNDPNALFGLAQAYRGKKDLFTARQYLTRALSIAPSNQLYQATLRDLDQDMRNGVGANGPQTAEGPQPAPDFRHPSQGDYYSRQSGNSIGWQSASSDPSQQPGQLTSFTSQGENQLQGYAAQNRGMGMGGMGMSGMGGMMGPMGAGLLAGGLARMMNPNPYGSYYGGTGSRLMRGTLMGGLAGAAIGGLMNMNNPGGFQAGAMRGGMTGGLMGLMTGL